MLIFLVETKSNATPQQPVNNKPVNNKPVEKKPVEKKPVKKVEDINDLSIDHFPEPVKRENSKARSKNTVEPKKNITGKAYVTFCSFSFYCGLFFRESGIDVQYGKGVDLSHVDMSNKGSKLSYEQPKK